MKLVLCMCILISTIQLCSAVCCRHNGRAGCCGFGKCNIFCCNCDFRRGPNDRRFYCKPNDKCDFNPDVLIGILSVGAGAAAGRRRRDDSSHGIKSSDDFFKMLDADKNSGICINEAYKYATENYGEGLYTKLNQTWFELMDKNKNGLIDRDEFDNVD
jgi:hypothetical protein